MSAEKDCTHGDVDSQPVADPAANCHKTKMRQIHWMVRDCTRYRDADTDVYIFQ